MTYDDQIAHAQAEDEILEPVSVSATMSVVAFALSAVRPGTARARVSATGEIHYGYPDLATWGGRASKDVAITVVD